MAFSTSVHRFARYVFFLIFLVSSNAHSVLGDCNGGSLTVSSSSKATCCATTPSRGWDYRITSTSSDHFTARVYETSSSSTYYTATECIVRSSGGACTGTACTFSSSNTCDADSDGIVSSISPTLLCLEIECDNLVSSCSFSSVSAAFYHDASPPPPTTTPPPPPPTTTPPPPPPTTPSWSLQNGDSLELSTSICSGYTTCQAKCAGGYSVSQSGSAYTLTPTASQASLPSGCECYTLTGAPDANGVVSASISGSAVTVTEASTTSYTVRIPAVPCTLTYTRSTGASIGSTSGASRLTRIFTFATLIAGALALL